MTELTNVQEVLFNPFAPGFSENPYPHYAKLRAQAPVYHHPMGFYLVSCYDDVSAILRSEHYSVDERNLQIGPARALGQDGGGDRITRIRGKAMIYRDAPDHTRLRRLAAKAFTVRAIDRLRPVITRLVDGMLDEIAGAGRTDFMQALAFPLPYNVITHLLGMPGVNTVGGDKVRELVSTLVRSTDPAGAPESPDALNRIILGAYSQLADIVGDAVDWKRRHPADDLITALIQAEHEGDQLSHEELIAQVVLLYVAGHETTINLLGNGTHSLLRNPDQLAKLRAEPELIDNAIEELLRYDCPVQGTARITTRPEVVRGVEIPIGVRVNLNLGSANRDEAFWGDDADELRLDRPNARQHLDFGGGPRYCIGSVLARAEGKIAFSRMVRRFPDISLNGTPKWTRKVTQHGLAELPISV